MTKIKKLLALTLSILMIVSALPLTVGAGDVDYAIKWRGGYDTGTQGKTSGTLYDGYDDIPWYITLTYGGKTESVGNIGQDWGPMLQISSTGAYANYDITPEYSGIYKFDIETSSNGGGKLDIYINGTKTFTYDVANTGDWNKDYVFGEVGTLALTENVKTTFSFKKPSGAATLRDCVLTLVEEIEEATKTLIADIDAIGEVTLDSEEAIKAAETAYDELTDVQKKLVSNYDVLTQAREKFDLLKEAEENKAVIEPVVNAIDAIGEVTLDSEEAINAAKALYDALPDDKKNLVTNYGVLEDAIARLNVLKQEAADRAKADEVIELIEAIGEVTLDSKNAIIAAENAYDNLTAAQKELVTNYADLTTAREDYNDLAGIVEVPDYAIKWMAGYTSSSAGNENGTLADGCEDIPYYITNQIDGENVSYGNLGGNWGYAFNIAYGGYLHFDITPAHSGLYKLEVATASKLGSKVAAYCNKVRCGEADIAVTGDDIGGWNPLTEIAYVILEKDVKTTISFSKASSSEKSFGLKDCVLTLVAQIEPDAQAVIDAIDEIGEVTLDKEAEIIAADEAYEALSNTQKKFVSNYDVLEAAKLALEDLREEAANKEAAQAVIDLIDAIGEVTAESEAAIVEAETAYGALDAVQRELVTNYDVLVAARATYNEITGSTDTPDIPEIPDVIPEDYVIKWKAGHDSGNADNKTGIIAEGYMDIPYYIINGNTGEPLKGHGNIGYDRGYYLEVTGNGHRLCYDIIPEYTGLYRLQIKMGSSGDRIYALVGEKGGQLNQLSSYATINTGKETIREFVDLAYVNLKKGVTYTIAFVNKNDTYNCSTAIEDCILSAAGEFKYEGASVENGAYVGRSTDVVTLDYTRFLTETTIKNAVFTLKDSEGNDVAFTVALNAEDTTKIDVIFNETLKYDETYVLTHDKVGDGYDTWTEETLTFTVPKAENDNLSVGNSTVSIDEIDVTGKKFTVTGTVYGSKGQTIAGRYVNVSVKIPAMESKVFSKVFTNADGKFTAVYELVDDEINRSGEFIFTADEEYRSEADDKPVTAKARYVSETDKTDVIGGIQNAGTAAEIEQIINGANDYGTSNTEITNVDVNKVNALGNKEDFYERLVGETFTDEDGNLDEEVFRDAWNLAYNLENIAQTTDNAVTELTFDGAAEDEHGNTAFSYEEAEEFVTEINLDLNKYLFLSAEKKADFIDAVTELPRQETAEAFGIECEKILSDLVAADNGKSDLAPATANASAYVGNVAKVDLTLPAEAEDVKEYTITVVCQTKDAAENIILEPVSGTVTKTVAADEKTVTFKVEKVSAKKLLSLGTLSTSRLTAGTDTFTVQGGTVTYEFDKATVNAYGRDIEIAPEVTDAILGTTYTVTTNVNNSGKPSVGTTVTPGKGTVSGGGFSGGLAPVVTPNVSGNGTNANQEFTDLAGVEWAENSIKVLYSKGIISPAADGKFRPTDNVTRAEFVKMLVTALRIADKTAAVKLADVSQGDWFYSYVAAAVNYGLVLGDEKGNFRPNDAITRQDVCVIISRAMDKLGYAEFNNNAEVFYDDGYISEYAKNAVYRMRAHEIVNGVGNGMFDPLSNANRAATAKMIEKFMKEANI